MKRNVLLITACLAVITFTFCCFYGCRSDSDATAQDVSVAEYEMWSALGKTAAQKATDMLSNASGTAPASFNELIVLTNAGYASVNGHTTQGCLDGLNSVTGASTGNSRLIEIHSAPSAALWFFFYEKDSGNGVYYETEPSEIDMSALRISENPFSKVTLYDIKADDAHLYANLARANEDLFVSQGFGGNEFRIVTISNAVAQGVPYDLIRAFQYHDHFCPGVTGGYLLVKYLEKNFPLTDSYKNYFALSIPPWCKDDAIMTLLNATPGKSGYGVFYLNTEDTEKLKDQAKDIAGVFFRWNGDSANPMGEAMALSFDFTESKEKNNWAGTDPWTWWESRLRMDLWFMDYLETPERFVSIIPVNGKEIFSLADIGGTPPSDLARPGMNPLERLNLLKTSDTEYSLWKSVGVQAVTQAMSMMKSQGASPKTGEMIVLTNAGYAEVEGHPTHACLDGLAQAAGVSRGGHTLIEIHSAWNQPLWFAIYDKGSGLCSYLQGDPALLNAASSESLSSDIFAVKVAENIKAENLYAAPAEYAEKFDSGIFGGNEFRIVTIVNAIEAGAPGYAVRSFEFHDHYCPGVTSGILMANYVKKFFPKDSYFVQSISPWCKEDALLVMMNATPGKKGYAVTYATDEDKAKWMEGFEIAATIIYGKNAESEIWEGVLLGFEWGGETGCVEYGNSVLDKLCTDLYYLDYLDTPESYVKVLKEFEIPEGETPQIWARPGVDPMAKLGLIQE